MRSIVKTISATDHRTVGVLYLVLSLGGLFVGGALAMLMRWQLGWPGSDVPVLGAVMRVLGLWVSGAIPAETYARLFTLHGTVMIFFVVVPLLVHALGTILVPLKIGSGRMAFPRLSGAAFWTTVVAGAILCAGVFVPGGSAAAGWTSYAPLSTIRTGRGDWPLVPSLLVGLAWAVLVVHLLASRPIGRVGLWLSPVVACVVALPLTIITRRLAPDGQAAWFVSLFILSIANILQAINFLTTITLLRRHGMTFMRLPLSVWAYLFTAFMMLLSTPVFLVALGLNLADHLGFSGFFLPGNWVVGGSLDPTAGDGQPLLWQHLFWFYSHPVVYIMILPAFGIVSDILSVFSRKPVFGYRAMVWSSGLIALLGFFVWAHHMYQTGLNPALSIGFSLATFLIAVPSGVKVFNWIGTIWGGSVRFAVPMLHATAFVSLFVVGGLSGVLLASPPVNVQLHDTYFVVAHIHYVLFGGSLFGIFAALTYWWPLISGRTLNERWGQIHFALTYVLFNTTFLAMHVIGLRGLPRRVADPSLYASFVDLMPLNRMISVSAFLLGAAQLVFLFNLIWSVRKGERADENPWGSATLEWAPGDDRAVVRGPYEYSSPLAPAGKDWIGQTEDLRGTRETQTE